MTPEIIPELDPVIHSQVRLAVLSILIASESAEFGYLKERTGATDGNLSVHLTKLEKSDFVKIRKTFSGKKPLTTVSITEKGRKAFEKYLQTLERIVRSGETK